MNIVKLMVFLSIAIPAFGVGPEPTSQNSSFFAPITTFFYAVGQSIGLCASSPSEHQQLQNPRNPDNSALNTGTPADDDTIPAPNINYETLSSSSIDSKKQRMLDITAGAATVSWILWVMQCSKKSREQQTRFGAVEGASLITPFIWPLFTVGVGFYLYRQLGKLVHSECKRDRERDVEYFKNEVERYRDDTTSKFNAVETHIRNQTHIYEHVESDLASVQKNLAVVSTEIEKLQGLNAEVKAKLNDQALPKLASILTQIKDLQKPRPQSPRKKPITPKKKEKNRGFFDKLLHPQNKYSRTNNSNNSLLDDDEKSDV